MKITSVYIDTSVVGGCFDPEFQQWSYGLFLDFKTGIFSLFLSELTNAEIEEAPEEVQEIYLEFKKYAREILRLTPEAMDLADAYINRKITTINHRDDARHIAMATIAGIDLLVSWNFKHIVHFEKIQKFNAVNIEMGYKPILIYSPREVTKHGGKSR